MADGKESGVALTSAAHTDAEVAPPPPAAHEDGTTTTATVAVTTGHTDDTKSTTSTKSVSMSDVKTKFVDLPKEFTGAVNLAVPDLLKNVSSVTLPSRLDLLGRRDFKILAALSPQNIGNSVLGWAPTYNCQAQKCCGGSCQCQQCVVKRQLYVLPWVFSRQMARINVFLRVLALLCLVILIVIGTNAYNVEVGRAWAIGTVIALSVTYRVSLIRNAQDGVMAFCRSMGTPEVEEFMFSYSWKIDEENVRTLAKAIWQAGVGVWIDVVKLCPGDEIRPMVRTMVNRVHRVVVFLSKPYVTSPNCCVEIAEAVLHPEKLIVCVLDDVDANIQTYLRGLGARMCYGIPELITMLDVELQDMSDARAYEWWRKQKISGAGVPSHVVVDDSSIPMFSVCSSTIRPPEKSLDVGPLFLAGDLRSSGISMRIPWLFILALIGLGSNFVDLYLKFEQSTSTNSCGQTITHNWVDYLWLCAIAMCNFSPFFAFWNLVDTRHDSHIALRPLLASRSIRGGIKVRVIGKDEDPVVQNLRSFLMQIGHLKTEIDHERTITVYVISDLDMRNELFGPDEPPFDRRFSVFIWSGKKDPFGTKDKYAQNMMRFLVLVAEWEKNGLAESLFSAIGVRVVDLLHGSDEERIDKSAINRLGRASVAGASFAPPAATTAP